MSGRSDADIESAAPRAAREDPCFVDSVDPRGRRPRRTWSPAKVSSRAPGLGSLDLEVMLDACPSHVAVLDEHGEILFVNRAWRSFGQRAGASASYLGANYLRVCETAEGAGSEDGAEVGRKLASLIGGETWSFAHSYGCGDHHFQLSASRVVISGATRIVMMHQDVTDSVMVGRKLAATMEQLLSVQEEERARIARELHDSTSQHLVAIGLGLAVLRRGRGSPGVLQAMRNALAEAHKEIRSLSYLLYPPELASQGLLASLTTFVDGFRRRSDLRIVVTTLGPLDELPIEVQRACFRIVQEALANVHRHAAAASAAVDLTLSARGLRIVIADDGRAASKGPPPDVAGVGIRGMQARVAQFGGELTVAHRSFGTVVDGFIPRAGFVGRAA